MMHRSSVLGKFLEKRFFSAVKFTFVTDRCKIHQTSDSMSLDWPGCCRVLEDAITSPFAIEFSHFANIFGIGQGWFLILLCGKVNIGFGLIMVSKNASFVRLKPQRVRLKIIL